MAKKVVKTFSANLNKNLEKGGAWMAIVSVTTEGIDGTEILNTSAWSNASAGKRWVKSQVQALTPRKSVKMIAGEGKDAKGKPTSFVGVVTFRSE
jgi:hypothetical protein